MRASPEDMAAGARGEDTVAGAGGDGPRVGVEGADTRVVLLMGSLTYRARPFV